VYIQTEKPRPGRSEPTTDSDATIDCLNAAFAADPNAIHSLIVNRVPCNQALADDPHVVVDSPQALAGGWCQVGALGLVNAVLTANGLPPVAVKFESIPDEEYSRVVGFCAYTP
jgi:hypothetical protein